MAEFRKVYTLQGFDREATPRWQMVPMTESRYVVLRGGTGLTVTSASPAIATVKEVDRKDLPPGAFNEHFGATDRFLQLDAASLSITKIQAKTAGGATATAYGTGGAGFGCKASRARRMADSRLENATCLRPLS